MATTEASQRAVKALNSSGGNLTRRAVLLAGWGMFALAAHVGLLGMVRFLFPNVLFEPPMTFKAGVPDDFGLGVDERFKDTNAVWLVRTVTDPLSNRSGVQGLYALSTTCTHLGCIPNYLLADHKFKCPCHGSGYRESGMNFEGPAPRPLERYRIALAEDGQVLVDKNQKYQWEKGQWIAAEAFLKV